MTHEWYHWNGCPEKYATLEECRTTIGIGKTPGLLGCLLLYIKPSQTLVAWTKKKVWFIWWVSWLWTQLEISGIFDIPSLLSLFLAFHLSHPEDTEVSEECFKKASAKTQVLVKTLLTSCSLMFHRPKQVTWSRIQHQASPEWGVIHWEHYLST